MRIAKESLLQHDSRNVREIRPRAADTAGVVAKEGLSPMRVLGYVRVSTSEQASSGAGLEAQRRAILAECKRRGWHLVETIEDAGYSARDLRRPGIQEALRALEAGEASALVVA